MSKTILIVSAVVCYPEVFHAKKNTPFVELYYSLFSPVNMLLVLIFRLPQFIHRFFLLLYTLRTLICFFYKFTQLMGNVSTLLDSSCLAF